MTRTRRTPEHFPPRTANPPERWATVVERVCRQHDVCVRDMISGWRAPSVSAARYEIWWTIRTRFGASYQAIGNRLGGYNHATVLRGVRRHQSTISTTN